VVKAATVYLINSFALSFGRNNHENKNTDCAYGNCVIFLRYHGYHHWFLHTCCYTKDFFYPRSVINVYTYPRDENTNATNPVTNAKDVNSNSNSTNTRMDLSR